MAKIYLGGQGTKQSADNAKKIILTALRAGHSVEVACQSAGRSRSSYDKYRKEDREFAARADAARMAALGVSAKNRGEIPEFPEFCQTYLATTMFRHQLQWYDLLEGREPRELHANQRYVRNDPDMLVINTPPDHPLALDTPLLTERGWITMGEVKTDDRVMAPGGSWARVAGVSPVFTGLPCFRVTLGDGESIVASEGHRWLVQRSANHAEKVMTTRELAEDLRSPSGQLKWRIRAAAPLEGAEAEVFDPYLLGYWLGDGSTTGSAFAVGGQDVDAFEAYLTTAGYSFRRWLDSRGVLPGGPWVVYVHKVRKLLPLGSKRIPVAYFTASRSQRLELLRGLMDSDGTITVKDGRARWVQHGRPELCRDVVRIIASLGYQVRMKTYGPATEISFKPDSEPVFRLERKAVRQFTRAKNRRTDYRTIAAVESVESVPTQCITVDTPEHMFAAGDTLTSTCNSKTTTITENYVTWRVCQDPNIRVILVSKTEDMAKKFLKAIKDRLAESDTYIKLQTDFGPFAEEAAAWSANKIYVSGADSGEHTPTIQAIGMGGQIYGNRADLVILDDCILGSNAHQFERQINWIQTEVVNRVASHGGRILLVGTRLAPVDLYREIFKPEYYADEESPWTYLTQPAVEEYAEKPENWVTLWPRTNRPPVTKQARALVTQDEAGLWPAKDGQALAKERRKTSARNWALVFQQEDVAEDSIFDPKDLQACTEERRYAGRMIAGQPGHRRFGMDGMYVVAGLDPAAVNYTAAVVVALDRSTGRRYVLNVFNKPGVLPHQLRQMMHEWTDKYGIQEWRVERNAFQQSIVQDIELQQYMHSRGCRMDGHHTDGKSGTSTSVSEPWRSCSRTGSMDASSSSCRAATTRRGARRSSSS